MEASENQKSAVFIESANFKNGHIVVQQAETTDGQPYYICKVDGKEIQLRNEGKWEQIWGDLNHEQVDELGREITRQLNL